MTEDLSIIVLAILAVTLILAGLLLLGWWSTGQFFSGSQHWAAFWILLLLGCSCGSSHRKSS